MRTTLRVGAVTVITALSVQIGLRPASFGSWQIPALNLRTYYVPSTSMEPTLLVGDYVVANGASEPARGQLVAYRLPRDRSTIFLKRIVGIGGDRIQMIGGVLHINGEPVKRERLADFVGADLGGRKVPVKRFRETLPNGASFVTLDFNDNGVLDNTELFTVPRGHYFMLGDNRDNSSDSRLMSTHGHVPAENVVGRVWLIYFSLAEGESLWRLWRWPSAVRWSRLFSVVD